MKPLKKMFPEEQSEIPIVKNSETTPIKEQLEQKMELIIMQDFGKFKKGQIVLEQHLIDEILASPQARFTRLIKGN